MGDKIVVMNQGVVEQFGIPQDIYDHPATLFVADFIGCPSMTFLRFEGSAVAGASSVTIGDMPMTLPRLQEPVQGALVLGVRPEHVTLPDAGTP